MNYKRLSIEDREKIHILINQGKSNRMIAEELDRSHTTIAREVSRFRTRFEYSPSKAHELASRLKPKTGTNFSKVTMGQIKFAQERLNNRPRKVLNWKTPKQEFKRLLGALET